MKLGDAPGLSGRARDDGTKCPKCGRPKKPGFALCRDCARPSPAGSRDRTRDEAPSKLPRELVLDTFYGPTGKLRRELFFELPQQLAALLRKAGLSAGALRSLFLGFRSFAGPLAEGRMDFDTAQERFGQFYVERVVRQVTREVLPPVVQDLFDQHRELALSDRREMLGLFEYLKNILCYFGEKEEARRR